MGNEYSSPRRDDEDTVMSGVSGLSYDAREKPRSRNKSSRNDDAYHPATFFDSICGRMNFDEEEDDRKTRKSSSRGSSRRRSGSDEYSDDDTYDDDPDRDQDRRKSSSRDMDRKPKSSKRKSSRSNDDASVTSYEDEKKEEQTKTVGFQSLSKDNESASFESITGDATPTNISPRGLAQPLASAFAKRCYFTKAGIGPLTQHYEGITLTGNTVLMLASAMKLKGCPTICDEDLRRVEQTFPNQFSRMPDELLLSSGWRRISKYCHFSGKPIPDGVPFFHSKERLHPQTGGYYFLLASSLGMERPSDVEALTIDMLILLQTDFPTPCEQAPMQILEDPDQWTVVTKFCFFSGGPINAEEDVFYEADFDGNPICMLAFLSPNLTPEELYRLNDITGENAMKSVSAVEEVDEVYNLTEGDFNDLKLYHLGPCRALPSYILTPEPWKKVLPRSFMMCREKALARAYEFESHAQEAIAAAGKLIGSGSGATNQSKSVQPVNDSNGYVEFKKGQQEGSRLSHDAADNGEMGMNGESGHYRNRSVSKDRFVDQSYDTGDDRSSQYSAESPMQGNGQSRENSQSPMRDTRSISPYRSGVEEEEFPDPEVEIDSSNEFDEFPQDERDPGVGQIVSPNEQYDSRGHNSFVNEEHPADEAIASKMSEGLASRMLNLNVSKDRSLSHSPVRKISPRGRQESNSISPPTINEQGPSRSPRKIASPKASARERLSVYTHEDDVIDVPDPSPRDFVSPMSNSSPSANFSSPKIPSSPANSYTKSSAMRGAQELLKKNRQQRLAIMAKRRNTPLRHEKTGQNMQSLSDIENNEPGKTRVVSSRSRGRSVTPVRRAKSPIKAATSPTKSPQRSKSKVKMALYRSPSKRGGMSTSPSRKKLDDGAPASPLSPKAPLSPRSNAESPSAPPLSPRAGANNDKSDMNSVASSTTSSVWTDTSEKDSRRALILKMAKSRMKSKRDMC